MLEYITKLSGRLEVSWCHEAFINLGDHRQYMENKIFLPTLCFSEEYLLITPSSFSYLVFLSDFVLAHFYFILFYF